ncbi:RNA polymerase sigma factor [Gracilibacillus dipsosauri]|uniref:RNA polymerase sigma factor n=1 Tax=Gracilibacillus dipsosauri TaxID=178340 RepID=UPI00240A356F|nr:sigma-70 family RNA polymerase sigma factor [Gracilibacillus dipsosauri]
MKKVQQGNQQALRILIERYKHHVFKVIYHVVRNPKDAEDLAQETFIKMVDALPSYQNQGFTTWLSRIAVHKAIDFNRKKQRQKEDLTFFDQDYQLTDGHNPEEQYLAKHEREMVRAAIMEMPDKLRLVVQLYHLEGLSYKEISDQLNMKESTIKMRLYRARNWMKENWKKEDF